MYLIELSNILKSITRKNAKTVTSLKNMFVNQ